MNEPTGKLCTLVGVDVGGTFTDLAFFDEAAREFRIAKVPSNRGDEAHGFMAGLRALAPPRQLGSIVHGTTVGTNALLERKGAKVGIITTAGFRDVLEMRRRDRPNTWGLWGDFEPVVGREFRLTVPERTLADGTVHTRVDEIAVRSACEQLLHMGVEALAIVFINSYANPENERTALAVARTIWPNAFISVSSEILPEIREFERTSTTTLNAYLQPVVAGYIGRLEAALAEEEFHGSFHIVQSNGGAMSTALAQRFPFRTALSGPAAGVIAAAAIGRAAGIENIITADLGGTSFDVSLIAGQTPALAAQTTIDFGLVIRSPMIEITTIGAGGGSIAHVDRGGLLSVGPESAGSRPGPVAYGLGNQRPTLTDANIVLGRINADRPIGGSVERLNVEAARRAIDEHVGNRLSLSTEAAAEAVVRVANAKMAGAIRLVSIERGHDPSRFTALPFGGGGALHVGALLKEVGLKSALVPRYPGITSALGCIIADIRQDRVSTVNLMLDGFDAHALDARMREDATTLSELVIKSGLSIDRVEFLYELDMHYLGQTHTVSVPLPVGSLETFVACDEALVRSAFEQAYRRSFSRLLDGTPVRIVNLRTSAIGRRPPFDLAALAPDDTADFVRARRGFRSVWFDGRWRESAGFDRLLLPIGAEITGPAVLEQDDATTVVDPDLTGRVDGLGNLVVERRA